MRWPRHGASWVRNSAAPALPVRSRRLGAALTQSSAPPVIVALGRTPLWALTGLNGITAMRGQVLQNRLSPAPVIATFHPSFVMRQNSIGPETEATFRADLAKARGKLASMRRPNPRRWESGRPVGIWTAE